MIASSISPLLLLLVLACPLMMVFMMRGGHGHGSHSEGHADGQQGRQSGNDMGAVGPASLDELRTQRDDLDAQIQALEDEEAERLSPVR